VRNESVTGPFPEASEDAGIIGLTLGESLLAKGADKILAGVFGKH
jgi:hypothetical protein